MCFEITQLWIAIFISILLARPAVAEESCESPVAQLVSNMCHLGYVESPTFSPDSQRIAYISDLNGSRQVWIVPRKSGFPQLVTAGDTSVPHVEWSPTDNDCLAFSTWPGGTSFYQIYTVSPDGTNLRRITPGGKTKNFGGRFTSDGKYVITASNARSGSVDQPCLLNAATRKMDWLLDNKEMVMLEDVSDDRKYALILHSSGPQSVDPYLLDIQTKQETQLIPDGQANHFYGKFAPDCRTIYFITRSGQDRDVFARIRLGMDGKPGPLSIIAKRADADLDYSTGWSLINPQGTSAVLDWKLEDGGEQLDLVDLASGKVEHVPSVPGEGIGDMVYSRDVKFTSFDGLELRGWLYKPNNQKGPGAFVIDFHGGPEAQARPTSEFQPFLAQGIGVFAPNIRGSSGRGKAFADLDNGALRVNAVKDIKSCADFLTTNGIADPRRLGIMGHSGGGYLAMAGVTEFPRLFAAALDSNGPVDRVAQVSRARKKGNPVSNAEFGDLPEEMLKKMSPAYNVDRIEVPIMILQGEYDDSTPDANEMAKKLKQRGIPVEYIVSAGENHNLYKIENRIKTGIAKVEFFVKYLHPTIQTTNPN